MDSKRPPRQLAGLNQYYGASNRRVPVEYAAGTQGTLVELLALDPVQQDMGVDGPEFLHAIVEAMQEKYPIDSKRIYLFGHSAGAVFALSMSVMEPQYFAATGIHAGTMNESFYSSLDNVTKRKLPLAIRVGTEDPYFSLTVARNTQNALKEHGFDAQVFEMKGHATTITRWQKTSIRRYGPS